MGFHLVSSLLTLSDLERSNRGQQLHFRLLLKNFQPDSLQTWWGRTLGGCLPSLFTRWRCDHFQIFYEFLCSFFLKIFKNLLRKLLLTVRSKVKVTGAQQFMSSESLISSAFGKCVRRLSPDCSHSPLVYEFVT